MSREKALYGLTMAGAVMLDLQNRIGSLERGKDADFIILSGDPLSVYTRVLETYIEGVRVFDFNNPKDRLYALGGQLVLWGGIGLLLGPWAERALTRAGRPLAVPGRVPA